MPSSIVPNFNEDTIKTGERVRERIHLAASPRTNLPAASVHIIRPIFQTLIYRA